jgi:hypothetical protein
MNAETEALKRWTTARARGCRAGVMLFRTDKRDGPVLFFSIRYGVPRQHTDLDALEAYVADIEQVTA